jgi:hypothetical protein
MKVNVNPFQPWRPTEAHIPPPLHAGQPWRPASPPPKVAAVDDPPLVEPMPAAARNEPRKHQPQPKRPVERRRQPSPGRTSLSQWAAVILLSVLGVMCLASVGWLRGAHAPRLIAIAASSGVLAVMAFNHRRSWYSRLTWMTIALALAAIAAWFVPTMHGVNLWSAYRQVEALRALPSGDVVEYQLGAAARRRLVQDFPAFAQDVYAAEQAWLRRTVDEAVENADRQLEADPHRALTALQQLREELVQLELYPSVRNELEAARRRAVDACAKAAAG